MSTVYYADAQGNYLGGFDGAMPPAPLVGIQVPIAPTKAAQKWSGSAWLAIPLTPLDTLASKLAAGLAIVSTASPLLNGTYALDQTSQEQLWNVALGSAAGLGLPGGVSNFG